MRRRARSFIGVRFFRFLMGRSLTWCTLRPGLIGRLRFRPGLGLTRSSPNLQAARQRHPEQPAAEFAQLGLECQELQQWVRMER